VPIVAQNLTVTQMCEAITKGTIYVLAVVVEVAR
jgi:hypothetical protein